MLSHDSGLCIIKYNNLHRFVDPSIIETKPAASAWIGGRRGTVPKESRMLDNVFGLFGVEAENEGGRLNFLENGGVARDRGEHGIVSGPSVTVGRCEETNARII